MELSPKISQIRRYESPLHVAWAIRDRQAWEQMSEVASSLGKYINDPPAAMRGGGILETASPDLAPSYASFLTKDRPVAVVPVSSEPGGRLTDVIHFPVSLEPLRPDATYAAYRKHIGDYVFRHWDVSSNGPAPFPEVTNISRTSDGRYVTVDRYRGYLRGIGKGSGALGIHELDTQRISEPELRHIVRAVNAAHPPASDVRSWLIQEQRTLPEESLLSETNPRAALRGQEWWIDPSAESDRLRELSDRIRKMDKEFRAIDPGFDAQSALEGFLRTNIAVLPHTDGRIDDPGVSIEPAIVHGALYPDNIQLARDRDGKTSGMTIMGGDRAHVGASAESVDWLIAASAESPAHQRAIIEEFLALHPAPAEKRALALHTLYRAIMEAPWFAKQKPDAHANLVRMSYDILNGSDIWTGVNSPLAKPA